MTLKLKTLLLFFITFDVIHARLITQISILEFIKKHSDIAQLDSIASYPFNFAPFPLYTDFRQALFPNAGFFKPVYILQITNGIAVYQCHNYSGLHYLFLNDCFLQELQIKEFNWFGSEVFNIDDVVEDVKKIHGRVAILSHHFPDCYGHWIFDILGQLAMLEIHNIEYDYLCVPYHTQFMKETLNLWGIDASKIIPLVQPMIIQADTIIICTPVTQTTVLVGKNANYNMDFVLQYIQKKFLQGMHLQSSLKKFCSKIFISRKKAASRVVPNEDEIFALFEKQGFARYELTELSVLDQIRLFHNAEAIVSFVGSGSTNIMFCKKGTEYIEIIQNTVDATFFYEADIFKLKYSCIDNSTLHDLFNGNQMTPAKEFPIKLIKDFLNEKYISTGI